MSIESDLQEINASLKTLVQIMQTGAAAPAALGTPEASPAKPAASNKGSTKKNNTEAAPKADALGNPEGTVYWVIEKHNTVAVQKPGDTAPGIEGAEQVSAEVYQAKKAEFEKKISAAAAQSSAAATAPSATAQADTASSSTAAVSFPEVVAKLTELSKATGPGRGREGVLAILAQFMPDVKEADRRVPKLEPLGKNAEILAATVKALAGEQPADDALFGA